MKGKHAAIATKRRLAESEGRIGELEAAISQAKLDAHEREEELKGEIRNLQAQLLTGIEAASSERIAAAEAEARRKIEEAEEGFRQRFLDAFKHLRDNGVGMTMEDWTVLCDIAGIAFGEVFAGHEEHVTRRQKRMTSSSVRHQRQLKQQAKNNPNLALRPKK